MSYFLIFHLLNFLTAFIRIISLLYSRTYQINDRKQQFTIVQENGCSVKLQDGHFDHSSRKLLVEDFIFNTFVKFHI